jgi:hypothetical protein
MSSLKTNPEVWAGHVPNLAAGAPGIDVRRAFKYLFEQPDWMRIMLMGTLYMFIPVVGSFAIQGYSVRLMKHLIVTGDDRTLPRLEGLGDLIGMGIAPAAASMIWMFPVIFIVYFLMAVGMAVPILIGLGVGAALKAAGTGDDVAALVGILVGAVIMIAVFLLFYAALIVMSYYLAAMMTIVEITGKIEYAWHFSDIRAFMRTLAPDYRRAFIGLQLRTLGVSLLGSLLCWLGIFPAMMVVIHASSHVRAQMYRLYLARGGRPFEWNPKM